MTQSKPKSFEEKFQEFCDEALYRYLINSENFMLKIGDIVQLHPEKTRNKAFSGCLMVVTDPKPWGAQGYVQALGNDRDSTGGQAYYRAQWDEMSAPIGTAPWTLDA